MPYEIRRDVEGCKGGFAVVTKDTGHLHGCHDRQKDALAQMRALYANTDPKEETK